MPAASPVLLASVVAGLVLAGCATGGAPRENESPIPEESIGTTVDSMIVGEWARTTLCDERVAALAAAGLSDQALDHVAGEGWVPGVESPSDIADPADPCAGARPLEHRHFFTADGRFGSRDDAGMIVDDAPYTLVDEDTIKIAGFGVVTFDFRVVDDQLFLEPHPPECVDERSCGVAGWAIAVAYPGLPWSRVSG
jgi:hypothetical protein